MRAVQERRLTQKQAASQLALSAHQMLQDRLVKELRLPRICGMDDASRYLPELMVSTPSRAIRLLPLRDLHPHSPTCSSCTNHLQCDRDAEPSTVVE